MNNKVRDDPHGDEGVEREKEERGPERVFRLQHNDLGEKEEKRGNDGGHGRSDEPRQDDGHDAAREGWTSTGGGRPDNGVGALCYEWHADDGAHDGVSGGDGKLEESGQGDPEAGGEQSAEHAVHEEIGDVGVISDFGNARFDGVCDARP